MSNAEQRAAWRKRSRNRSPASKAGRSAAQMTRNRERREYVQAFKLAEGCSDCGYREHPEALELDHLGDDKTMAVSRLVTFSSWERLLAEIAKCEVVCANCHRIRTAKRRNHQ